MNLKTLPALHTLTGTAKTVTALAATAFVVAASPLALADISVEQRTVIEASGGMSMMASETTSLMEISGDRSRNSSTMKMNSRLMSAIAGGGETANIVRLDKQLTWDLLPEKKQYSELTFAEAKAQMEKMREAMADQSKAGSATLPVAPESCTWSEGNLDIDKPRGTQKIAGIKAKQHVISMTQVCTDPKTGKSCEMTWKMDNWMSKKVPGEAEVRRFQEAYAKAMGFDDLMAQVQGAGQGLVGMFAGNWDEVMEEFKEMDGYPLRTVMAMEIGGEECTTASGQQIAMDDIWADASIAGYNAALNQAGSEAGGAVGRAAADSLGNGIGSSIGGAAVGAAAGELFGGLTGMFKKNKSEKKPKADTASANGKVMLFRITNEVTGWSDDSIASERFEEPTGWKKR